jgi:uncharacterized protein YjiS (DUF1127 family)
MSERVAIRGGWLPSLRFPGIWDAVRQSLELRRSRRALIRLGDHHLLDVGLTRAMAEDEARRSFMIGE